MEQENKNGLSAPSNEKKKFWTENRIEILVAILLGVTALLSAWCS